MKKKDITKLLRGRKIVDAYRAETASTGEHPVEELKESLKRLGFKSDNPIEEFFAFNEQLCIEAFANMNIQGECDFCVGYKGEPSCKQIWGSRACFVTQKDPKRFGDAAFARYLLASANQHNDGASDAWEETLSYYKSKVGKNGMYWYCPEGHGFYINTQELETKLHVSSPTMGKFSLIWR